MGFFRKRKAAAFALALSMTMTCAAPAFAEGSKELTSVPAGDESLAQTSGTEAYRPYLEWRDRTQFEMASENIVYAYANAGETIYFGSSVTSANDRSIEAIVEKETGDDFTTSLDTTDLDYAGASIAVTLPKADGNTTEAFDPEGSETTVFTDDSELTSNADRGKVYLFNVTSNGAGHISDTDKEQKGPNGVDGTTDGYEPLSFTAPYTGTYSFRFLSSEYATSDQPVLATIAPDNKETVSLSFDGLTVTKGSSQSSYIDRFGYINVVGGYSNNQSRGYSASTLTDDVTINGVIYASGSKYLSTTKAGTENAGYIEIVPLDDGAEIEVVWGHTDSSTRTVTIKQGDREETPGNKSAGNYSTYFGDIDGYEIQKGVPVKIWTNGAPASIYAINYYYDKTNEDRLEPAASPTPAPTAVTVPFDFSLIVPTATPESTATPEPTATAEPDTEDTGTASLMETSDTDSDTSDSTTDDTATESTAATATPSPTTATITEKTTVTDGVLGTVTYGANDDKRKITYKRTSTAQATYDGTSYYESVNLPAYDSTKSLPYIQFTPEYSGTLEIIWYPIYNTGNAYTQLRVLSGTSHVAGSPVSATTDNAGVVTKSTFTLTKGKTVTINIYKLGTAIYAINYIYTPEAETTDATATPTPTLAPETYDKLARKVAVGTATAEPWADSPAEVAAWDVTVAKTTEGTTTTTTSKTVFDVDFTDSSAENYPRDTDAWGASGSATATPKTGLVLTSTSVHDDGYLKWSKSGTITYTATSDGTFTLNARSASSDSAQYAFTSVGGSGTSPSNTLPSSTSVYGTFTFALKNGETLTLTNGSDKETHISAMSYKTTASASTSTATAITGRVWSDIFFLNAGGYKKSIYPQMNVLTQDGFLYNMKLNGIQPYGFMFYANNRGYLFDDYSTYTNDNTKLSGLQPLEHSFYSKGSGGSEVGSAPTRLETDSNGNPIYAEGGNQYQSQILGNYVPTDPTNDFTHKLFLNTPSDDAITAYTTNSALKTGSDFTSTAATILDNLTYSGRGSYADNTSDTHYGTMGVGGIFSVTLTDDNIKALNGAKNISVKLDFSDYELSNYKPVTETDTDTKTVTWKQRSTDTSDTTQTTAEKNNIVTLTAAVSNAGTYTLAWDGRDAYGNDVPAGEYSQNVTSYVEMGVAHFPILDAEHNPNGIKIKMANTYISSANDTVYYNNYAVSPNTDSSASTAWYYSGNSTTSYPKQIGDGQNMLAGVSSNYDTTDAGAMTFGDYDSAESDNDGNTSWGYGNFAALDIWTKYEQQQDKKLSIGVKAPTEVNAYVSFVSENGENDINSDYTSSLIDGDTTLNKSHIKYAGHTLSEDAEVTGESDIYGNTISTGFFATLRIDDTSALDSNYITWEVTLPDETTVTKDGGESLGNMYIKEVASTTEEGTVSQAEEQGLLAAQMLYEAAVKNSDTAAEEDDTLNVGDETTESALQDEISDDTQNTGVSNDLTSGEEDALSALSDDTGSSETTTTTVDISNYVTTNAYPVLTDSGDISYNKGSIYRVTGFKANSSDTSATEGKKIKIKIQQDLSSTIITVGNNSQIDIKVGLVIDNIYAPDAYATAQYGDAFGSSDTYYENKAYNAATSYQGHLEKEDTLGHYDKDKYKGYTGTSE